MNRRLQIVERFFDQILEWQRRNLSVSERDLATIITLISVSEGTKTIGQLERILAAPQSYTSHLLADLNKKGWVKLEKDPLDRRQTFVTLKQVGKDKVLAFDRRANEISLNLLSNLEALEQNTFLSLLNEVLDQAGIVRQDQRKSDSIVRPYQRRIAALIGITGRSVVAVPITSVRLHLLDIIAKYDRLVTAKDLSEILSISEAAISQHLAQYFKDGLVYTFSQSDARKKYLSFTPIGQTHLRNIHIQLVKQFDLLLTKISTSNLVKLTNLFGKFLGVKHRAEQLSKNCAAQFRKEMIELAYQNRTLDLLPELIASKQNLMFKLEISGQSWLYLHYKTDKKLASLNFVSWSQNSTTYLISDKIQAVNIYLSNRGYKVKIEFLMFSHILRKDLFQLQLALE